MLICLIRYIYILACSVHHTCNMRNYNDILDCICTRTSHDMGVSAW